MSICSVLAGKGERIPPGCDEAGVARMETGFSAEVIVMGEGPTAKAKTITFEIIY